MGKSSFISNFRKLPLAFLLFLAIFILGECLIRTGSSAVLTQNRNLAGYNKLSRKEDTDIVAIGHSAVKFGINAHLLSEILSEHKGRKIRCFNLAVNSCPISLGYFIFKNIVVANNPSLVIIGFWKSGLASSDLKQYYDLYHTLREYTRFSDIPVLFKINFLTLNERVDFILRKISCSYSYRYDIKLGTGLILQKLFKKGASAFDLIRGRLSLMREIEEGGFRPFGDVTINAEAPEKEIDKLFGLGEEKKEKLLHAFYYSQALINLAKQKNIRLLFIAMPTKERYILPEETKLFLKNNGVTLLDFSDTENCNGHFAESTHLDKEGTQLFTRDIAKFLLN